MLCNMQALPHTRVIAPLTHVSNKTLKSAFLLK